MSLICFNSVSIMFTLLKSHFKKSLCAAFQLMLCYIVWSPWKYNSVIEYKELIHRALAEPNTRHRELQQINVGYFVNGAPQENGKLTLKSLNSPMACRLQIIQGKITRHHGLGDLGLCWELIGQRWGKGNESFLQDLRTILRSVPWPSV